MQPYLDLIRDRVLSALDALQPYLDLIRVRLLSALDALQPYLDLVRDRLLWALDALLPVRDFDADARTALAARREPVFREIVSPASPWAGRRRAVARRSHSEAA